MAKILPLAYYYYEMIRATYTYGIIFGPYEPTPEEQETYIPTTQEEEIHILIPRVSPRKGKGQIFTYTF